MKNTIAILLLIACALGGCSKIFKSNLNTFTVTGTLLENCGGKPIANAPVRADMYGDHTFNSDVLGIGNAVTDANGHFSMKCSTAFAGVLVLGVNGVKYIDNFYISNSYPDINFKNIYGLVQQSVYVKIIAGGKSYTAKDTLFFYSDTLYPISNKAFLIRSSWYGNVFVDPSALKGVNAQNSSLRNDTGRIGWGIGWKDYLNSAQLLLTPPYYHVVKYIRLGCAGTDTALINIP
jgi:hypothetical protein